MAELKRKDKEASALPLTPTQVLEYLKAHPDFILRHPELLEQVQISHKAGGSAISLIERQVDVLRTKNERLQEKLDRLMEAARGNEKRADNVHRLARTLIRAPSLGGVVAGLRQCMREDFGIEEVFIGLSSSVYKRHDISGVVSLEAEGKVARVFENFFRTRLIECGPIAEDKVQLLFPAAKAPVLSAAIVPLEKDKHLGMIGFGSSDAERFQPRQGKLFLEMMAELISAAVRARL